MGMQVPNQQIHMSLQTASMEDAPQMPDLAGCIFIVQAVPIPHMNLDGGLFVRHLLRQGVDVAMIYSESFQ